MDTHQTFATAINCMDGRVQQCVTDWAKQRFGVDFVDAITEAGPNGVFARADAACISSIKDRVLISTGAHQSKHIVVTGHHGCAGNPVTQAEHADHIRRSVATIKSWGLDATVTGLWVNDQWQVEVIAD